LTISGRRTGYALPAWVYVPDAYFDPTQPTRQFPVTILLAGYPGAIENWQRQGHIVEVLDRLMSTGRIPPMILVSATQNPVAGRDSECVDAVGGARADTYLSQDVPESIGDHLRVLPDRSAWSLMGYSTGGYCAVDLALRHPGQFSAAVALDGYFGPAHDATTGDLFRHNAPQPTSSPLPPRRRTSSPLSTYRAGTTGAPGPQPYREHWTGSTNSTNADATGTVAGLGNAATARPINGIATCARLPAARSGAPSTATRERPYRPIRIGRPGRHRRESQHLQNLGPGRVRSRCPGRQVPGAQEWQRHGQRRHSPRQ
jgi:pimeloyl-ACP methyl ester carboxylesterase